MSEKTSFCLRFFLIATIILYAICAFTQFNIEVDEWSSTCRAVMAVSTLLIAIWVILIYEKWDD